MGTLPNEAALRLPHDEIGHAAGFGSKCQTIGRYRPDTEQRISAGFGRIAQKVLPAGSPRTPTSDQTIGRTLNTASSTRSLFYWTAPSTAIVTASLVMPAVESCTGTAWPEAMNAGIRARMV